VADEPLALVDKRIASAWAALSGARAAANHSPTGERLLVESMCERTLDELLDQRWEITHAVVAG
jgi:hypothetical protein